MLQENMNNIIIEIGKETGSKTGFIQVSFYYSGSYRE